MLSVLLLHPEASDRGHRVVGRCAQMLLEPLVCGLEAAQNGASKQQRLSSARLQRLERKR